MSEYQFVVGRKQDNFSPLKDFREAINALNIEYDRTLPGERTEHVSPFKKAQVIVMVLNQREVEPVRGFASLTVFAGRYGVLSSAFIRPEDTRQGLWSSMTDILIQESKRLGIKNLMVSAAEGSQFLKPALMRKGFEEKYADSYMWRRQ